MIFVAGFGTVGGKQHPGGQITSSQVLLNSMFAEYFELYLIDTTAVSHPPEGLRIKILKASRRMFKYFFTIISKRPDAAILFASSGFSFFEKILLCSISRVFGVRSILAQRSGHFMDQVNNSRLKWIYRLTLRIPNVIICQGSAWLEFYSRLGISNGKCEIMQNLIDPRPYAACRTEQPKGNGVTFLFVGRLVKTKGIYELLNAVNLVRKRLPGAKLIIVGGGPEHDNVINFIRENKLGSMVNVLGWCTKEETINFYRQADVFVLPTHMEGFPNVLLEAMCAGLPVITTRVGGIPDSICGGLHGILIDPHDTEALAEAMFETAENYEFRKKCSQSVVELIMDNHDVNVYWQKLAFIVENHKVTQSANVR